MTGKTSLRHNHLDALGQQYLLAYSGASPDCSIWYLASIWRKQNMWEFAWKVLKDNPEFIWGLALLTSLTQAALAKETLLPPQYKDYAKVFEQPMAGILPHWHPFDHAINLKEMFVPKFAKAYPLNPKEMDTCKEFIDKHLKSGKIQKSQSPQASPFFFVQKKDGGLCSCQDYWYSDSQNCPNVLHLLIVHWIALGDKHLSTKCWCINGSIY